MAALTLIAVTVWLHRAGKPSWFTLIPAALMLITTIGSLTYYLVKKYIPSRNILLSATDILLLILAVGVLALAINKMVKSIPRQNSVVFL